ncbi:MAG TPA: ATP-dependent DNA helicase, partial [Candidatus Saccharimonadales bacterium]|nr:ATP-dependent DNA helicase [Candidatus Saccharimonadales bacterium]
MLQQTDTLPESILCLTFTEAGIQAMRDRLSTLLGRTAYDVNLNTYHAFGGDILRRYPEYFEDIQLELVDDLGADIMLRNIISRLPYGNQLKYADNYINDIKSFIKDAKEALLLPEDIAAVASANLKFIGSSTLQAKESLARLERVSKKSVPIFRDLARLLENTKSPKLPDNVQTLAECAHQQLLDALNYFDANDGKTTELSRWKNVWLAKDADGNFIFDGRRQNERLAAAAEIYRKYQRRLKQEHLYDYSDMILRVIDALSNNLELKYSVAEQYQFIMLDEFQDTNPAQFRLVQLLTDHPVHEGRPNILAVGDDDQAIFAFQGANHANMAGFVRHYDKVKVISLEDNYRAYQPLLDVGANIASQISDRLHQNFEGVEKTLIAKNTQLPKPQRIEAREFKSDAAHNQWIADEVNKFIKNGIRASEIAILAPKHRFLLPLLPYLAQHKLPVRYERRENILDEPLVRQLEQMSRLIIALHDGNEPLANSLWPEVLSYDFWQVPVDKIWKISWHTKSTREPWTGALLNDSALADIASFFLSIKGVLSTSTLEEQLDSLIGHQTPEKISLPLISPLFEYYFGHPQLKADPRSYTDLISDLNVLRNSLREWRRGSAAPLGLRDFVEFIEGHRSAGLNILNTSPYHEDSEAVNLLTAYGAKGREFRVVFIAAAVDEVWGSSSRNQGYRLSLPANLTYIRYQGASEDERLRLLYVAVTRARSQLYFTSYLNTLAGKPMNRLKYLDIAQDEAGKLISQTLPQPFSEVIEDDTDSLSLQTVQNYWTDRHRPPFKPPLRTILAPQLQKYQLSATHLNHFLDIQNAGPESFFMECILGFPSAPNRTAVYGTAMHNSLRWAGSILSREGSLPAEARLREILAAQLGGADLLAEDYASLLQRGQLALHEWLTQSGQGLNPSDKYEYDFQNEGVFCDDAHLSGKIDRLIINQKSRTITVVDYKTGQSYKRWQGSVIKLHKFRQQLMIYKLLAEGSNRFKNYTVTK